MPLTRFRFSVDGDVQVSRAFELTEREAADMSEPLGDVGDLILASVEAQFATEGAASGARWQALNKDYARWKAEHFPGAPILVRTRAMRQAAVSPDAVHVTPERLVYEIDDPKAQFHQKGKGHMPARKIVDLNQAFRRRIDRAFHEWVNHLRRGPIGAR